MTPSLAASGSRRNHGSKAGPAATPAIVGIVALAIAVGCSVDTGSPPASAMPTAMGTASPATPITHATGSADLVLRVQSGGGLLPMEMRLAELPTLSVFGDGRVIRVAEDGAGPTDPLVPRLVESRLAPEAMTTVLAAAADAGLLGPDRRYELQDVYDLWSVTFTLTANRETHTTWAYALGFSDEARFAPPDEMPARKALGDFFGRLKDLRGWLGSERVEPDAAHRPGRMRVFVAPVMAWPESAGGTPAPATARAGQDVREWPLDAPPDVFGDIVDERQGTWRCGLLDSVAADRLGVGSATNDTRWQAGDLLYRVVVRPLLPDEAGCTG